MIKKMIVGAGIVLGTLAIPAQAADPVIIVTGQTQQVSDNLAVLVSKIYVETVHKYFDPLVQAPLVTSGLKFENNVCRFTITSIVGSRTKDGAIAVTPNSFPFMNAAAFETASASECVEAYAESVRKNFTQIANEQAKLVTM